MNKHTHTAGPWSHHKAPLTGGDTLHIIQAGRGRGITVCQIRAGIEKGNSDRIDEVCELNARLIAAAPDLLAVLENMFNEYGDFEYDVAAISAARAAVAKAKGERNAES